MNLDELKSFCNSNSLKNYEIYNNFNSEFNIYVGIFGNSNHIYIKVNLKKKFE